MQQGASKADARKVGVKEAVVRTLGLPGDSEVKTLLRRALRDSEAAAQKFGWHVTTLCELPRDDDDVGYTQKDGTIFVKVRDPNTIGGAGRNSPSLYAYSFVLATLLHELVHLSHLGHGKAFYRCLSAALAACSAEAYVRREAKAHVCAEILNAICDNDARRAKALLAVIPEAAVVRRPGAEGNQTPLEYAAHHGRVALTRLLLEAKADPAQCRTVAPLARAAANGNTRTATLLLAARANVADVQEPHGQSVLDKAIAASEAGGIASKGGEWWKIPKLLGEACADSSRTAPEHERRRRSRRRCSDGGERSKAAPPPMPVAAPPPPAPSKAIRKALSLPQLPRLPGAEIQRRPALSCLAGSLAL